METRKILIANNKTQRRYSIETSATTLGELQDQMTAQGIDFSGMTFTEGLSKTQLISRDSLLPTNVMYKGTPTNNLVMLLTNPVKQIASGAMSRKEAYEKVKALSLQNAILEACGKNYTQVKTDVLEEMINCAEGSFSFEDDEESEEPDVPSVSPVTPSVKSAPNPEIVEWFFMGVKALTKKRLVCADDLAVLNELISEYYLRLKESEPEISDKDIDDMLESIC